MLEPVPYEFQPLPASDHGLCQPVSLPCADRRLPRTQPVPTLEGRTKGRIDARSRPPLLGPPRRSACRAAAAEPTTSQHPAGAPQSAQQVVLRILSRTNPQIKQTSPSTEPRNPHQLALEIRHRIRGAGFPRQGASEAQHPWPATSASTQPPLSPPPTTYWQTVRLPRAHGQSSSPLGAQRAPHKATSANHPPMPSEPSTHLVHTSHRPNPLFAAGPYCQLQSPRLFPFQAHQFWAMAVLASRCSTHCQSEPSPNSQGKSDNPRNDCLRSCPLWPSSSPFPTRIWDRTVALRPPRCYRLVPFNSLTLLPESQHLRVLGHLPALKTGVCRGQISRACAESWGWGWLRVRDLGSGPCWNR